MKEECCNRERVKNVLKSLGKEQLGIITKEDKQAEVKCPYCNKTYYFNQEQLEDILISIQKNSQAV